MKSLARQPCSLWRCALGAGVAIVLLGSAARVSSDEGDGPTVETWRGLQKTEVLIGKKADASPRSRDMIDAAPPKTIQTRSNSLPVRLRPPFPYSDPPHVGLTGAGDPLALFTKKPLPAGLTPPPVPLARIADRPLSIAQLFGHSLRAPEYQKQSPTSHEGRPGRVMDLSEAQEQTGKFEQTPARSKPSAGEHLPPASGQEFFNGALLFYAALIVAVAIIAPLVSFACFFWLLGRHSRQFGPLLTRPAPLELPQIIGPLVVPAPEPEPVQEPAAKEPEAPRDEPVALARLKNYHNLRARHAQEQREAILGQLLSDNLQLYKEIRAQSEPEDTV